MSHTEEHIHIEDSHHDTSHDTEGNGSIFVRVIVIIAIITILLFVAWSIVKFVPKFISSFGTANVSLSSLFKPKDGVSVSTNASQVKDGEAFSVNWENTKDDGSGTPMLSFGCVEGVNLEYNSVSGVRPIVCNTSFPLPTKSNTYSFFARNTGGAEANLPITISYIDSDMKTVKASGSTSITVSSGDETNATDKPSPKTEDTDTGENTRPETTTKPRPTTTTQTTPRTITGTADLQISLIKIGRTTSDGGFEETRTFYDNDRVTVRFNVANVGNARSGTWVLRANLPTKTQSDKIFNSGTEPALNPGDSYELTISFDTFDTTGNSIVISMDANDKNQSNNVLTIPVDGRSGGNNTSNGTKPDLTIDVTDVGVMDRSNNRFYNDNSLTTDDKVAVKFVVTNEGGTSSGTWTFTIDLPTTDDNNSFYSGNLSSLAPGEKREFIIGFDNPESGTHAVKFEIDSNNNVNESNERNNTASESIRVTR